MPSKPDLSLVLDLSAALSIALVDSGNRTLACRLKEQGARGETAHALLEECLAEAGRDLGDLADICVGIGPGSFTGIRVCAALAQGLAFAKRLPLYPFSSLAGILACAPSAAAPGPVEGEDEVRAITAIAANAGRYFVRAPSIPTASGEAILSADQVLALASPHAVFITAGNFPDRERFRPAFHSLQRYEELADFGLLARLAHKGTPVLDGILRPNYLMASAAEDKRKAAGAAGPGDAPK